jgi:hypothetical protein
MRGLFPRAVCPAISRLSDAWVSHPSSERLRRPPSPSRGEGIVGRPLEDDGRFGDPELAPVSVVQDSAEHLLGSTPKITK